jgi:uncharacterized protein YjgD (DUF1641 family)
MDAPTDERRMIEAEVQQVVAAARAALTDEMVARMATTAGEAIDLMDQVNRAGLARAIPAIAEMVNNGDLNRLARLARVYASAEDALTDEMVGRMTDTVGQGLSLLDQVNRAGLERAIPAIAELVNNGDLNRISRLARVYASAEDALTDEMVGRMTDTIGQGLSLLDQVNRAGLERAIPAIAELVNNGDLSRISRLARVYASAEDALTDEMVGRMTDTIGQGLSLLDQVNRAGLERAIPAIAELVNNGDLNRISRLARVYASAEDALTDEMVGRLAETVGNGLSLLDRFSRGGAEHVVSMLEDLHGSGALERIATLLPQLVDRLTTVQEVLQSIDAAAAASREAPPSAGGVAGLWHMMRDPETQDTLRFLLSVGKTLRKDWGAAKK